MALCNLLSFDTQFPDHRQVKDQAAHLYLRTMRKTQEHDTANSVSALAADPTPWVRAHTAELLRYAKARVQEVTIAEDLVQQTFVAAWESRERFTGASSPRTWLFSILKNKLADHYRKAYRDPVVHGGGTLEDDRFTADGAWKPEHLPHDWEGDDAADAEAMNLYLHECLGHLPANWRAAVEMKYLKEQDAAVVCQELGITPTNYWQQLHRAKVKLRDCITHLLAKNR